MPMTCVAYGCNNHFFRGCGKQFFRFPMKDPIRLFKWVTAIRRKNWKPSASSRICSDHFTDNDYMLRPGAMVPRLRLDAVPTIFNGFPKHLKDRLEKKKKKKIDEQVVVICNPMETQITEQLFPDKEELKKTSCSCDYSENTTDRTTEPSVPATAIPGTDTAGNQEQQETIVTDCKTEQTEKNLHTEKSRDNAMVEVSTESSAAELLGIQKNELSSGQMLQVKLGPVEKSLHTTCVVYGCNNIFVKGCGKQFFRFPLKNPEQLCKWIQAVRSTQWKPSASTRICSDHFKDKDYILQPGMKVPRLHANAVPFVCKEKRSRRNNFNMDFMSLEQLPEMHRPPDHTYSTLLNAVTIHLYKPDTMKLKKKVKTLQRQVQRQRHTMKKLSEKIAQLRKKDLCSITSLIV
ncbi:uncharacterized protein ACMZJ9_010754 [Mantella aurantiaca]